MISPCRDDVESVVDDGKSFLNFCPDWQNAVLWQEWKQFGIECFSQGLCCFYHHYHILIDHSEPPPSCPKQDRSQTIKSRIPIPKEHSGRPAIPSTTMSDGYATKVVQSMLREYCTAHLRESAYHLPIYMINIYKLGFMTGNKKQVIPWGSLIKDPTSWMIAECIPDGFEWKDPSKIHVGEVFRLLDHWRDREDQGLDPLAWVLTSPLFKNTDRSLKGVRPLRHAKALDPHDSDEEVFVLPNSEEVDEEDDGDTVHKSSDHVSAAAASSGDGRSTDLEPLAMQPSDHIDGPFGESDMSCP